MMNRNTSTESTTLAPKPLTKHQVIDFLICQKFPLYPVILRAEKHRRLIESARRSQPPSMITSTTDHGSSADDGRIEDYERKTKEVEEYRAALMCMSPGELQEICDIETRAKEERAQDLKQRRFREAYPPADFVYWSKAPYWTIDESVALILARAPELATWQRICQDRDEAHAAFRTEFQRLRNLVLRAQELAQLPARISPRDFVAWTRGIGFEIPISLIEEVEKHGMPVNDWKDQYEKLHLQYQRLVSTAQQEIAEANEAIRQLQLQLADAGKEDKPDSVRRTRTLLTLIAAICQGLHFDYKARGAAARIAGFTENLGVPLSDDTIRCILKEIDEAVETRMR